MNKLNKMTLKYKIALGFSVVASVFGLSTFVAAGNFFNWANVENRVADKIVDKVSVQDPNAQPEAVLGNAIDTSVSNYLNVNGFLTYTLIGYMGNGAGSTYATTTVAFTNPFKAATSTAGDIVIDQVSDAFGYTGATSTVNLVQIVGIATTTAFEFDCTAAATKFATSTPAIINTEQALPASSRFVVTSGMASSTAPGSGSFVKDSGFTLEVPVTKILLTPQKPYLVCRVWHSTGGSLSSFTDSAGSANVKVVAQISRLP